MALSVVVSLVPFRRWVRVVTLKTLPGRLVPTRMILRLTSSSISRRTPRRRRCRSGRTGSLANSWKTSYLVSEEFFFSHWILTSVENGGTALHSAKYHLLPADLRIPPSESLAPLFTPTPPSASLGGSLLSPNLPTLLLFECVLVYVAPEASEAIIQWFVDHFASSSVLGAVVYEMFGLNDPFGTIMVENLKVLWMQVPTWSWALCLRYAMSGQGCLVAGCEALPDI